MNRTTSPFDRSIWIHILPFAIGCIVIALDLFGLIDAVLILTQLCYVIALVRALRAGECGVDINDNQSVAMQRWFKLVIVFLTLNLLLDMAIALSVARGSSLAQSQPLALASLSVALFVAYTLLGALGRPSLFEALYQFTDERLQPEQRSTRTELDPARTKLAQSAVDCLRQAGVYDNPTMTILRLARRLGVPARQLSEAINQTSGQSFSDLLNDIRIEKAKAMLRKNADRGALDVMLDVGYSSKSNFYKQFAKRTGMTPGEYTRSHKSTADKPVANQANPTNEG